MFTQREAIVKLLSDDDPPTVDLVKEQLIRQGEEALGDLQMMLGEGNETVRRHVGEVMAEIDTRQAAHELSILCPLFPEEGDIEQASWLLARAMIPGTAVERYQRLLDQHGRELKRLLVDVEYPKDRIGIIGAYLCETHGFSGNTTDYYDPDNSLLSRVIDSRHGIPISLTLLYMIVGARAGMRIEGVNLPGHFLAKHDGILFDPFENGRIVMLSDCNAILARQNLTFSPDHFEVASPRMMLRRTLANLLYIYQNDGGEQQASRLAEWIKGLERN